MKGGSDGSGISCVPATSRRGTPKFQAPAGKPAGSRSITDPLTIHVGLAAGTRQFHRMKRLWLNIQFYTLFFLFSATAIPGLSLLVALQAPFVVAVPCESSGAP